MNGLLRMKFLYSIYQHNTHSLPHWAICYSCDVDIGTQVLNNGTEVIWLVKIAAWITYIELATYNFRGKCKTLKRKPKYAETEVRKRKYESEKKSRLSVA